MKYTHVFYTAMKSAFVGALLASNVFTPHTYPHAGRRSLKRMCMDFNEFLIGGVGGFALTLTIYATVLANETPTPQTPETPTIGISNTQIRLLNDHIAEIEKTVKALKEQHTALDTAMRAFDKQLHR